MGYFTKSFFISGTSLTIHFDLFNSEIISYTVTISLAYECYKTVESRGKQEERLELYKKIWKVKQKKAWIL